MKKLLLTLALLGAITPRIALADEPTIVQVPAVAALATVIPFIEGFKEPQGLALDYGGDIIVCDSGAGEVLRFSKEGEKKDVLASGLKRPSQITARLNRGRPRKIPQWEWVISERDANRVIVVTNDKKVIPLGGEIMQPLGIVQTARFDLDSLYVVAPATAQVYCFDGAKYATPFGPYGGYWQLIYQMPVGEGDKTKFGLRYLTEDGSAVFVSDSIKGEVIMMSRGGRMATFASGFNNPSGMEIRGDWLYVCDEGNGGQLWKVDKSGAKTLVAEKLGRPCNVLFLDDVTALLSDRNGRILKLSWAN